MRVVDIDQPITLEELKTERIPWGPIGETVYKRTYSQNKENGQKEIWPETTIRAVEGNLALVDKKFIEPDEREKLIRLLFPFGILPGGRHLNASGMKGRQFLFNCHASGWDTAEPEAHFTFLFDALMQGGGVGANYSNRYLETLPPIQRQIDLHIVCREDHPDLHEFHSLLCPVTKGDRAAHADAFLVPDSREGWVEAVEKLMKMAWADSDENGPEQRFVIDVSDIRKRGSPLKTSGGIACGPGPLVKMLSNLVKQLNSCFQRQLTSLDAMTIDHILADCVVAGGKRRSSRMSVKNWLDVDIFEFINCKRTDGAHWTTNISVEIDKKFRTAYADAASPDHDHAKAVMRAVVLGMRTNGEPGFWDIDLAREGEREPEAMYCPNPCGEICLHMWENCNLGHINMEYFASRPPAQMMEAYRLMTRWLIRATNGDIPNKRQRAVVNKNRRISVGFLGFHGYLSLQGVRYSEAWKDERVKKTLRQARGVVDRESEYYSVALGQPIPVKNTGLAPTGSVAPMAGTSTSAQTIEFPWYKRRVRYANGDPELMTKIKEGYVNYPDEDAQNTTIVEYWCENPLISKVRANDGDPDIVEGQGDVSVENYLQMQAMLQENYVNNAISFTIPLSEKNTPTEEEMEKSMAAVLGRIKGCTMYPDRSRKNAPFEALTREQFEKYEGRKEIMQVEAECKGGCPT
jgi:ribonucleoside-triphosphate reductase (thioredoxin)